MTERDGTAHDDWTLERLVAWVVLALVGLLNGVAYVLNLWSTIAWYDNAMHFVTPLGVTGVLGVYIAPAVALRAGGPGLLTAMIGSTGVALAVLWEIGEWGFDQLFTQQSVIPGKTDTIIDLILGFLGCLVAAAIVATRWSAKRHGS